MPMIILKIWMFIAGAINIGIGIGFIVLGAIWNSSDYDWTESMSGSVNSVRSSFFWACLGIGIFMLLTGMFAIVGGLKRIKTCIAIYSFTAIIFFALSVALAVVSALTVNDVGDFLGTSTECNKVNIYNYIYLFLFFEK